MGTAVSYDSLKDIYTGQMLVYLGDNPLAFCKNAELKLSQDPLDAANKMAGNWDVPLGGKKSFNVTTESMLTHKNGACSYLDIAKAIISGATFAFWFGTVVETTAADGSKTYTKDTTEPSFTGTILPTECDIKSENGSIATCSGTFKGVGALTPVDAVAATSTSEPASS
jgi:hypothetical protein